MCKGLIFNIQKFSINDGPGIRTTVFFKGCPLRCQWCANPESQSPKIQVTWDYKKCVQCGTCVHNCPHQAITLSHNKITIDHQKCTGCLTCVNSCPQRALASEGQWLNIDDVYQTCLQDLPFYEESGGGVTLSGGEVLASPDAAITLMKKLKKDKIHIALETSGLAHPDVFAHVTQYADLLLFDMKHWNDEKHIEGTGVSHRVILENMKKAVHDHIDVLPRIPVIPGFNDALDDARHFAALLHDVGLSRAQLLPFHNFGENKWALLNKPYAYQGIANLHREDLEDYRQVFLECGIEAFF